MKILQIYLVYARPPIVPRAHCHLETRVRSNSKTNLPNRLNFPNMVYTLAQAI